MKRAVLAVVLMMFVLLTSCSVDTSITKKEPPELKPLNGTPASFVTEDGSFSADTIFHGDTSAEFRITRHDSLEGITVLSSQTGLTATLDDCRITFDINNLPDGDVFSNVGRAIRTVYYKKSVPVFSENVFWYTYPEEGFKMAQNAETGQIISIIFSEDFYVKFSL